MRTTDAAIYARWRPRLSIRKALKTASDRRLKFRRKKHDFYHSKSKRPEAERQALAMKWHKLVEEELKVNAQRKADVVEAQRVLKRHKPTSLREKAYKAAASQVGVMESGGNNRGTPYERYEKPNGATGPEPWCGDFVAWCYRKAGSKRVTRPWASVALIRAALGIKATSKPQRGDLVRFNFDHIGIFVRDLGGGMIETVEGNTGASGAVSDSSTGGDGVYRKHRSKRLVRDYLRVLG